MKAGERFLLQSAGGGGYGDPHQRDRAALARDIAEGYVSATPPSATTAIKWARNPEGAARSERRGAQQTGAIQTRSAVRSGSSVHQYGLHRMRESMRNSGHKRWQRRKIGMACRCGTHGAVDAEAPDQKRLCGRPRHQREVARGRSRHWRAIAGLRPEVGGKRNS